MKLHILGSRGMLGNYVSSYLGKHYQVTTINREKLDAAKALHDDIKKVLIDHGVTANDVIINCAGTIKTRVDELGDLNAITVNATFPRHLANVAEELGVHLIHPTTDCVYSGLRGEYTENDKYDVNDVYGMSKALGEPKNATVIRTSIIGEEVGQKRSLVEWVKGNEGKTVNGFTNHHWNGLTCLQFAKVCKQIIDNNLYWNGTKHIHSNDLTKKELVETISDVYGLNIVVDPKETPVMCNRTLRTIDQAFLNSFDIPSLRVQIEEMKDFGDDLRQN